MVVDTAAPTASTLTDAPARERPSAGVLAAATGLLMFVVMLPRLGYRDFWQDEAGTWGIVAGDLGELWRIISSNDVNGSAYYVLLWGWQRIFGSGAWQLRLLATVLMALAAAVFVLLAARWVRRRVALTIGLVFAFHPFLLDWGRQARQYALAVLLVLLLVWALDHVVAGEGRRWWLLVGAAGALLPYAHGHGLLALGAIFLAMLVAPRDRWQVRDGLVVTGVIGLAAVPVAWYLTVGDERALNWVPPLSPNQVKDLGWTFLGEPRPTPMFALMVLAVGGLGLLGVLPLVRSGRARHAASWRTIDGWRRVLAVSWFAVPILATIAVSVFAPALVNRYLIVSLPAMLLLVALGLDQLPDRRWLPAAVVGVFLVSSAVGIKEVYGPYADEPWSDLVEAVAERVGSDDAIVVFPPDASYPIGFVIASGGPELPDPVWPERPWDAIWDWDKPPIPAAKVAEAVQRDVVWVIARDAAAASEIPKDLDEPWEPADTDQLRVALTGWERELVFDNGILLAVRYERKLTQ